MRRTVFEKAEAWQRQASMPAVPSFRKGKGCFYTGLFLAGKAPQSLRDAPRSRPAWLRSTTSPKEDR
jgi:hypothetical protein